MTATTPVRAETAVGLPRPDGRPLPAVLLVTLAVLVVVAAAYGLVAPDAYRLVPPLTRATWRAQDAVMLAVAPTLVVAGWRAARGSLVAHVLQVGLLAWLAYAYAHLSIAAPFNPMFLVYVAVLAVATFALLDGLVRVDPAPFGEAFARAPFRAATWFLVVGAVGMALLWLSDIVPALPDELPREVHLAELPNPTWVLDLAWVIPASLGAAWMTHRRHPAAALVAGSLLVMLLVLSVAMLATTPFALAAGLGDDGDVRGQLVAFTIVFTLLGAFEAWLVATASWRLRPARAGWRRGGWWPEDPGVHER